MEWVNNLYGKKYIGLRNVIWEKGFKSGHCAEEHGLSAASVAWLDKAIDAYYSSRIHAILKQASVQSSDDLLNAWDELMYEMVGEEKELKNQMLQSIMQDANVSAAAKNWMKKVI